MNLEEIKELIRVFGRSKLDKLKIKDKDFEISLKKEGAKVAAVSEVAVVQNEPAKQVAMPQSVTAPEAEVKNEQASASGELITSPMVGTFYAAPSPDSPPFVNVGDVVRKGQTLCILEAMKIMNELEAEYDCKILEVLVQDGEPVEYDTPLFRVEKL
jgi:acetyl-CoA carboxylase biotin carboxyl carrier protein